MKNFKYLLVFVALFFLPLGAFAQGTSSAKCGPTTFTNNPAHKFCGNNTGSTAVSGFNLIGSQDVSPNWYVAGGGTANAQTATLVPALTSYVAGEEVHWFPSNANSSTTPTLNVNGLGAVTITKLGTTALADNDLTTTAIAIAVYDGTYFELQNPQTSASGSGTVSSCATSSALGVYGTATSTTIGCGNADFTYATHTLTSGASGLFDLSATTSTSGFKVPVKASDTAAAAGVITFDSTGKNYHVYSNGADAIIAAIASAPTTTDCAEWVVSAGNVQLEDFGSGCGGSGISGLTTGYLPKASSGTAITNSLCDEGITTANILTCTDSAGAQFSGPVRAGAGSGGAGAFTCPEGTANGHSTSETIVLECPASVTAYEIILPGASASGIFRLANSSSVDTASISELSGDVTTSGSNAATVVKINGAAVPASAAVLGSNSSSQAIAATPHQVALPLVCADTSSSSTTYTCATTPTLAGLTTGDTFIFTSINQNNSGSSTLNIDTIGAKTIKKWQNTANLASGDLQASGSVLVTYDGTYLEVDRIGNAPSGSGTVTSVVIAGTSNEITVAGTCTITATGTCTLSIPSPMIAPGIVDGLAPVTDTAATTATLGAGTYQSGYTFNQYATAGTGVTYTLPATVKGMTYCVANSIVSGTGAANTGVITVYPPASSYVIYKGVINTIGGGGTHGIASGGAAADSACFVANDSTHWTVYVSSGTWAVN